MKARMIKEGDRVSCKSDMYSGTGTVFHVQYDALLLNEFYPIQVELDEPDNDGHSMKRFNLKEIKFLEEE